MLGGGGGERGGGRVVGGALGCQLPAPAGLGGRVLLGGLSVSCAGAVELSFKAACTAKDLPDPGRRCRGEILPCRGRQWLAELTRVERRVGVSPPQGGERDDRPVTNAGLEQLVEFGEAGADVCGHGCRLGLAVLDIELLALPFAGSSLPLPVTLGLGRLADHLCLGPLEFPGLPLASTFPPRTLLLYLRPQPLPLRHANPQPQLCPQPLASL